jgi:hypothetical protein
MAHKTYLELVNEALTECKTSLDPLTSGNFSSPPRTLTYNLMKTYINRAYKHVLLRRNEWFYRNERAVVTIYPRLQLRAATATPINIGDTLSGDSSGTRFEVLDIHAVEDVETDTTIEYTLSVEYIDGPSTADNLVLNELVSIDSPTPATGVARVKGRGRYSMSELVPQVDEVDEGSFSLQPAVDFSAGPSTDAIITLPPISFVAPEYYRSSFDTFSVSTGQPSFVFRAPDGTYDFYPRPNVPYDLCFNYSQEPVLMSVWDDVPELLDSKYDDLILWIAVSYYADYDERPKLYARAKKHMNEWSFFMDRDELPKVAVNLGRFDYNG